MSAYSRCAVLAALLVVIGIGGAKRVEAQFLRLGPFDVDANTSLNLIYTTNVEGRPKSDSELEREDYFLVWSLSMNMAGTTTPTSEMTLDTSMSIEKHFIRDDLDNSSDPFGNVLLNHSLELGRLELPTVLQFTRRNRQDDDGTTRLYIPGQRTERVVQDTRFFSQGAIWQYESLQLDGTYTYREIRFQDEEFQEGDENQTAMGYGASWSFLRWRNSEILSVFYRYNRSKTELVNRPDGPGSGEWQTDQQYGLGVNLEILTRPSLTYSMTRVKSDDSDWRVVHAFSLSDEWQLSSVMLLDADARYTIDEQPREDDVRFIYSVGLAHELGRTMRHSVRATREPVDTFGSTTNTDQTTVAYDITKSDLFFANVTFNGNYQWRRSEPKGEEAGPVEEVTSYSLGLSHATAVSRRLDRNLSYVYRWSKSNLVDEPIDEHRVILGFTFTF